MGEESIMRPPASKKAAMTRAHSSLSTGSSPTLKVIQVPSPTIGISSRVEGMGRRVGEPCWARRETGRSVAAAVAAREACTNVRRVVRIRCSIIAAGKLPRKKCAGVTERHRQHRNTKLPIKTLDQICSRATSSICDGQLTSLNQLQSSQTCVTILAGDEVVVDGMPSG